MIYLQPSIANHIGLKESILLQQIHTWGFKVGNTMSAKTLTQHIKGWSIKTTHRLLKKLDKEGFIRRSLKGVRTTYTPIYGVTIGEQTLSKEEVLLHPKQRYLKVPTLNIERFGLEKSVIFSYLKMGAKGVTKEIEGCNFFFKTQKDISLGTGIKRQKSVRKYLLQLCAEGVLKVRNGMNKMVNDRTLWYAITPKNDEKRGLRLYPYCPIDYTHIALSTIPILPYSNNNYYTITTNNNSTTVEVANKVVSPRKLEKDFSLPIGKRKRKEKEISIPTVPMLLTKGSALLTNRNQKVIVTYSEGITEMLKTSGKKGLKKNTNTTVASLLRGGLLDKVSVDKPSLGKGSLKSFTRVMDYVIEDATGTPFSTPRTNKERGMVKHVLSKCSDLEALEYTMYHWYSFVSYLESNNLAFKCPKIITTGFLLRNIAYVPAFRQKRLESLHTSAQVKPSPTKNSIMSKEQLRSLGKREVTYDTNGLVIIGHTKDVDKGNYIHYHNYMMARDEEGKMKHLKLLNDAGYTVDV